MKPDLGRVSFVVDELHRDGKGWILLMIAVGWFLSIGVRFIYPSVMPFFRAEFDLGLATSGLLLSVLWFSYALGQFPGGILGDRIGEGNILVISTGVSTAAILAVANAPNVVMLFIGTIAFGAATSLYGPTRFTIFTDIYRHRAGTAVGLSHAAGSLGNTVLPALAAMIAVYSTWRLGFGVLIPLFVGVTIGLWAVVPARTSSSTQSTEVISFEFLWRLSRNITQRGIPIVVTIQILIGVASQGFLGFYPTYLIEVKGFSPGVAAALFSAYFAISILIQPLTGVSTDRFGAKLTLSVLISMFFVGLTLLHFAESIVGILLITVFLSHRSGTGIITNTYIANNLSDGIKGTGLGFLRMIWLFIGAISPILVGYLGDLGLLNEAFLLLAGLAGAVAVMTLYIPIDP